MGKGKILPSLFLLVVAVLFLYGVTKLLVLRFEKGDIYPPYSSYRSDPMGAKAFYEGLGLLPGVKAVRNVEPLRNVSGLSEATVFLFGIQGSLFFAMGNTSVKALEDAALEGGRVVISFVPSEPHRAPPSKKSEKKEPPPEEINEEANKEKDKEEPYAKEYGDLSKRWSVKTELCSEEDKEAILSAPGEDLPPPSPGMGLQFLSRRIRPGAPSIPGQGSPCLSNGPSGKAPSSCLPTPFS